MIRRQSGLSLIEVLIAMLILAGAFLVLGSSWSGSLLALRKTRLNTTVTTLLQKKMTEMEIKYREKPDDLTEEGEAGDFGGEFPEFRWEMKSRKLELPDMADALTARDGGASEMEIQLVRLFFESLKEAIKEMKVTVFYKLHDAKEMEYSVTTYVVKYPTLTPPVAGAPGK